MGNSSAFSLGRLSDNLGILEEDFGVGGGDCLGEERRGFFIGLGGNLFL